MSKKDNSQFARKVLLRRKMIERMREAGVTPVVLETHGGYGKLYTACYADIADGVVFEQNGEKASRLALQRPAWSVYEGDSERALLGGVGAHQTVTGLDVDPYGDPHPTIRAFFASERPRAERLWVVVNDGLLHPIAMNKSWQIETLKPLVLKYGNTLHSRYLEVCRELMEQHVALAGYRVEAWAIYACGRNNHMLHYLAELVR